MRYNGGRYSNGKYVRVLRPGHPNADRDGYIYEHIAVAEAALGRFLPQLAVVHHINNDGKDNRAQNLVICQDQAYHTLLHQRARALQACGHADWRRCWICRSYGPPSEVPVMGHATTHRACFNAYTLAGYHRRRKAAV